MYVFRPGDPPALVFKIDVASGRRALWKELSPANRVGGGSVLAARVTPDGRAYAYTYAQWLDDIVVVDGLK